MGGDWGEGAEGPVPLFVMLVSQTGSHMHSGSKQ